MVHYRQSPPRKAGHAHSSQDFHPYSDKEGYFLAGPKLQYIFLILRREEFIQIYRSCSWNLVDRVFWAWFPSLQTVNNRGFLKFNLTLLMKISSRANLKWPIWSINILAAPMYRIRPNLMRPTLFCE